MHIPVACFVQGPWGCFLAGAQTHVVLTCTRTHAPPPHSPHRSRSPGRAQLPRTTSSHPPLTHRPISEQTLESLATAAWAKAAGPQRAWWREMSTAGTRTARASPSPSRTAPTTTPRLQAMAATRRVQEAGSVHKTVCGDSQTTGQTDRQTEQETSKGPMGQIAGQRRVREDGQTTGQRRDYRCWTDRWVTGEEHATWQTRGCAGGGLAVIGALSPASARYGGRTGHMSELPVSSSCSQLRQDAKKQRVHGEFSPREEPASALNSFLAAKAHLLQAWNVPTAPSPPTNTRATPPQVLEDAESTVPRGAGRQHSQGPQGCPLGPNKARPAGLRPAWPPPPGQGQRGKGGQQWQPSWQGPGQQQCPSALPEPDTGCSGCRDSGRGAPRRGHSGAEFKSPLSCGLAGHQK